MMDKAIRAKLPKAPLLSVGRSWRYPYFASSRLANCVRVQAWWLTIQVRASYLEHAARAAYPHLFH